MIRTFSMSFNTNSTPKVYFWGRKERCYEDFDERHKMLFVEIGTSTDRIHRLFENSFESLSKSDLLLLCPDISQKTMERVLNKLKNDGKIQMIGSGKNTKYLRK